MLKKIFLIVGIFFGFFAQAQKISKEFRTKTFAVVKDSIVLDTVSINPAKFTVFDTKKKRINPKEYRINFAHALLLIKTKKYDTITVNYYVYPDFITKTYTPYDKKLIVPNNSGYLYKLKGVKNTTEKKPFDGLETKGFIVRGITSGNNQNAVTNAELNLEISGKLSKDVTLRANIYDTNIPLQDNGYSQNITDFDRVFIEMYSKNWRVKAGDISVQNNDSYFIRFHKQIAGLEVATNITKNFKIGVSGAIVKGKFADYNFTGIEGNQGPYKIFGSNNEPGIIIIAGSENVFVNGTPLKKGANNDYLIDYNLAEIRFNTTYPVTSDMRIRVEYQYADQSYTRFISYEKAHYKKDNFTVAGYFYNETDAKNSPLQQNLTTNQQQILANAGNNLDLMVAESGYIDTYSDNKILYKKTVVGTVDTFEYSTDETQELYNVTFTNVGTNNGDYILEKTIAIGNIFKFVGVHLGNYSPIIRLTAPSKLQIAVIKSDYQPSEKLQFSTEIALSNTDKNLFSTIEDNTNKGVATILHWKQLLIDKKWQLKSMLNYEFKHQNFNTVQRFEEVEFARDWNIVSTDGNKNLINTTLLLENKENGLVSYTYQQLKYGTNFMGNKHSTHINIHKKNTHFLVNGSLLNNTSTLEKGTFLKFTSSIQQQFTNKWAGAYTAIESNLRKEKNTLQYYNSSHRFKEFGAYLGLGDSTKVFLKFGFNYRKNDSIKNNTFTEVNNRKTMFVHGKIIQNNNSHLSIYANYRTTTNTFSTDEKSLNSKVVYQQKLFANFITTHILYETASGNVARQDFVYIKTEPGQGFYTWVDYNNDGVKDLDEFEVAQFQDQAEYLRVPLPNLKFIATQRAKWQQSIAINPTVWKQKNGVKKFVSHFYNQSYFHVVNEQERNQNSFHFNPLDINNNKLISLQHSIRNTLYFNRGLQKNSLIFTYATSKNKQQFFSGNQENTTKTHQLEYQHKFTKFWLLELLENTTNNTLTTENFINRNYHINATKHAPKLSYVYNKNHRLSIFYTSILKNNTLQNLEKLTQNTLGFNYYFSTQKGSLLSATIHLINNTFTGNSNSPVAYQMLEGLQTGKNYTWSLLAHKKLNSYMNLNLNYFGRKSNSSKTIHTGTIELKAIF